MRNEMTSYLFQLPIGDPFADGHGMSDYFTIKSNKDVATVKAIFKKMNDEVHLTKLFEDSEQCTISDFAYERLIAKVPEAADYFRDCELELGTEGAAELFIACMHAYDYELHLEVLNIQVLSEASFGYGLFSL
jgi:hypothetical protein